MSEIESIKVKIDGYGKEFMSSSMYKEFSKGDLRDKITAIKSISQAKGLDKIFLYCNRAESILNTRGK